MYKTRMPDFAALRLHLLCCNEGIISRWGHDGLARPYWRVYWNQQPGWTMRWDGGEVELGPTRIVLIGPETVYAGRSTAPANHVFMHFTLDGIPRAPHGIWSFRRDALLAELLQRLRRDRVSPQGGLAAAALGLHLIGRLPAELIDPPAHGEAVQAALVRLASSPAPCSNQALARLVDMHPNAFIRRFRSETGLTPQAWHVRRRIELACLALEQGDETLDELAERFHFYDRHHFTRAFSRWRGVGPATYRASSLRAGASRNRADSADTR